MMAIMQQRVKLLKALLTRPRWISKGVDPPLFNKDQVHGPSLSMAIGVEITAS